MKKIIFAVFLIFVLSGCDLIGGNSDTTNTDPITSADVTWENLTEAANTYTIATTTLTSAEWVDFGQVGATPDAMCIVVWRTATAVSASCRNTTSDGQWPVTCAADAVTGIVACGVVSSTTLYFISALGISRTLTLAEAELADEIRRQTYCDAPRIDGTGSPCTVL